ncbi:MAG: TetR/AcrR family transcriptional regulator [Lachnospiraceae bacterium]|nr:TetR/AcrR family transcriptional regulator [Lachnospiraceae bacterium]
MAIDMKTWIADKLFEMMKEKKLDKITVKELVEECHISRQAFYYHFQDLMDVLEWSVQKKLQSILETASPEEALEDFTSFFVENRGMMDKLHQSRHREQLEQLMMRSLRQCMEELFYAKFPDAQTGRADLEAVLDFCACGVTGLLVFSIRKKNFDEKSFMEQVQRILAGAFSFLWKQDEEQ